MSNKFLKSIKWIVIICLIIGSSLRICYLDNIREYHLRTCESKYVKHIWNGKTMIYIKTCKHYRK